MSANNICVAVRVRPFNAREKKHKSKCCIQMFPVRGEVQIKGPADQKGKGDKKFTFDYVYWSHDDRKKNEIISQRKDQCEKGGYENKESNKEEGHHTNMDVYNNLGKKILENSWQGYNASIFAYGQTGSGKSYSMVGYGEDLGIIPLICNELFERVEQADPEKFKFKVQVSMIEIYNERVRDLFGGKGSPGGLKVRENPKFGPYVEGLKIFPVKNYSEIDRLMELGSKSRTVAATAMNQTSSRAHTLFSITLTITEIDREAGKAMDRASRIVLVDLAGSERAKSTGASGDRLKEGCAINQSLSALGNVISKLVEKGKASKRKKRGIFIPYRTSTLTWLLRESLGGNARTIMVAALSPASINYEETLSTLKYADRAKQIQNKAVVNEDPNVTMIKALKKELDDLRNKLAMTDTSEMEKLREELEASRALIQRLEQTDEDAEKEKNQFERGASEALSHLTVEFDVDHPCISNLHPDKQIAGRLIFVLNEGEGKIVGRKKGQAGIVLGGVGIKEKHSFLENRDGRLFIKPGNPEGSTYVNGELLEKEVELHHFDRIIFGSRHTFRVNHPKEREEMGEEKHSQYEEEMDYTYAQQEYAEKQGLMMQEDTSEKEVQEKIQEEMKILREKKEEEERKLSIQRDQLKKQQEMMKERMKEIQRKAREENATTEELERRKREFEEKQRLEQADIGRKQKLLEEKQRKLREETKRQEELQRKIREKELRDRTQRRLLEKKLFELIPMVSMANDYAKELSRTREFRTKLVNFVEEDETGTQEFKTDIVIETENTQTGKWNIWKYEKFESRFFQMEPIYEDFTFKKEKDEKFELALTDEDDPFWDPDEEVATSLGISMIYLKCLSHMIDMKIWTPIINPKGIKKGELHCGILPCTIDGELLLDDYISNPKQLIGKPLSFQVVVESAKLDESCTDCYVCYQLHKGLGLTNSDQESDLIKTKVITRETRFPSFYFSKQYNIDKVTQGNIETLRNSAIKFEFFGKVSQRVVDMKKRETAGKKMLRAVQNLSKVYSKGNLHKLGQNEDKRTKKELSQNVLTKLKRKK